MQTKHPCVLIQIWTKVRLARHETGLSPTVRFLLTFPRRWFFCGSFMLFLSCFCYAFVRVCLLMPCGQLLGKGWPLGSRLWCLIVKLSLSHWYPGSGVEHDLSIPDLCPLSYFQAFLRNLKNIDLGPWCAAMGSMPCFTARSNWIPNALTDGKYGKNNFSERLKAYNV